MIAEEYGPEIRYIQGEHNVVADALSRLEKLPNDVLLMASLYPPVVPPQKQKLLLSVWPPAMPLS
jgi:hypothetical protein